MTRRFQRRFQWTGIGMLAVACLFWSGCDEDRYDRDPPSGQGSMVVDNVTGDRVLVYIDGAEEAGVSAGKHRYYDRAPGVYRVVLDGDDTSRSWAGDVDFLEGRRTVLEVRGYSGDYDQFDVEIYLD